jgi:glycine oxidase
VQTFDVAIVGGGLIGVAAALELRARNLRVVLLDRQQPGREASWAAAGMLAPASDGPNSASLVLLARESLKLYPEFVAAIELASGRSTGFAREGTLEVFFGPPGESARDSHVAERRAHGLSTDAIELKTAREMEPSLGPEVTAAAWLWEECTVDPRLLIGAAISAAGAQGVEVRANCAVSGLVREGSRCAGVVTDEGKIAARFVLVAAGCFSSGIPGEIGRYAPTRPVRGQMLSLRHPDLTIRRVLRSTAGYLVPRADGRILAGSTLEAVGFEKVVTPDGVEKITAAARRLVPALDTAEIVETWAGLRPGSADDLPILGPTDVEGLLIATGHYRDGILLAPVTAKLVGAWVSGEATVVDTRMFSPMRFQRRAASGQAG